MKQLVTPEEVAQAAFGCDMNGLEGIVDSAAILSAQRKFLQPVLGELLSAIEEGKYDELLEEFVKPALVQWVKYLVLPALSAQIGAAGAVRYDGVGFSPAGNSSLTGSVRLARGNAAGLTKILVEHLEAHPEEYPEYDPDVNIMHHTSIDGGVIL